MVTLPAGHPLTGRSGLRLGDLVDARWIDAPDVSAPLARPRAATATDGFRAALPYAGTDPPALLALVAAGHGLTVLPTSAVRDVAGLVGVPATGPRLVHRIESLRPGEPPPVA